VDSRVVMAITKRSASDAKRRGMLQKIVLIGKRIRQMLSLLEWTLSNEETEMVQQMPIKQHNENKE